MHLHAEREKYNSYMRRRPAGLRSQQRWLAECLSAGSNWKIDQEKISASDRGNFRSKRFDKISIGGEKHERRTRWKSARHNYQGTGCESRFAFCKWGTKIFHPRRRVAKRGRAGAKHDC